MSVAPIPRPEPTSDSGREAIASEVRALMGRRRVSQSALARRLGISQPAMSRRLSGEVPFDTDDLYMLMDVFGVGFDLRLDNGVPSASPSVGKAKGAYLRSVA